MAFHGGTTSVTSNECPPQQQIDETPDPSLLSQVVYLLHSCRSPNTTVLQNVHQKIQEFNTNVEFNFYLLHIVKRNFQNVQIDPETLEKTDEHTRQLAFILLKNNVKRIYPSMPQQLKHRIKETTLSILGDETRNLRHMVGVVVTGILQNSTYGFEDWPELLPKIVEALEKGKSSDSVPAVLIEGIFSALDKICEDCSDTLELDLSKAANIAKNWKCFENGDTNAQGDSNSAQNITQPENPRNLNFCPKIIDPQPHLNPEESPLYQLLPLFIDYFNYQNPEVKSLAVSCCNHFIVSRTGTLNLFLDKFITGLFALANDNYNSPEYENVQRQVCRALVLLLEIQNDCLESHMPGIVDYMLYQTQCATRNVAIEACEFWLTLAEQSEVSKYVLTQNGRLGKLVPILIKGMKYAEDDPILLKTEENDGLEPDNDQDIRPRTMKASKVSEFFFCFFF